MFRITLLLLSVVMAGRQAHAQMKSLCTLITADDAKVFFDKAPDQKVDSPELCSYGLKGQSIMLTAMNYTASPNAKHLFDMNRQGIEQAKASPKDEQGLGATAFSASTASAVMIFLLKGNATVQIAASSDKGTPIAAMLDKLRIVAKKAAGRM